MPAEPVIVAGQGHGEWGEERRRIVVMRHSSGAEVMPGVGSTSVAGIGIRLGNSGGQAMTNAAVNTGIQNEY